jgi:cell division protein ZapA (FtsZ GTPase activity inhibitor)
VSEKRSVSVTIQGKQYKIRADGDGESVTRAAQLLDQTMDRVRERSGTADSIDVAVLAALNLANRLTSETTAKAVTRDDGPRIDELIRLVEGAVHGREPAAS